MNLWVIAVLEQLLFAVPLLVGVVLVGARTRGSARRLGVVGCVIMLVCRVLSSVWSWVLMPRLNRDFGYASLVLQVPSATIGLVSSAGLMLVIIAVVTGRSAARSGLLPRPSYPPA